MTTQYSQQNIAIDNIPPTEIIPAFKQGDYKQFMRTVEALAQMPTPIPSKSDFRFDFTMEAAIHNSKLIEAADFDPISNKTHNTIYGLRTPSN
jgi:hypothetical protein